MPWNLFRKSNIDAVFGWLSGIVHEADVILVKKDGREAFYRFKFPLRQGDIPKRAKANREEATFIIHVRVPELLSPERDWIRIFYSPEIAVFEKKSRVAGTPPLRWGLNNEEKLEALKIARSALEKFLLSGERIDWKHIAGLSSRFFLKSDLDVALWVNGRLRGSAVVKNGHLSENIIEAVIIASRDSRFKPLGIEELPQVRIECTLMNDFRIPLSKDERRRDIIYHEKGYLLDGNGNEGWFLPEVHNIRRYKNLENFLGDLAQEKTGLSRESYRDADVFIFEVDDFIESENLKKALTLYGPTVRLNPEFGISDLNDRVKMAADWLCRIREPDGNIPPTINPLTGYQTQVDWPRLAFTAWALAEFGKKIGVARYIEAAKKSADYLRRNLLVYETPRISSYELALAYFGQLSLALGQAADAEAAANIILGRLGALNFEPLAFAQIASFFKKFSGNYQRLQLPFETLAKILKNSFREELKNGEVMNLAVWAELANTFYGVDNEFLDEINDWLKNRQLPNGSFPESTRSDFAYTRGTGKIFEVLALDPQKNKDALIRSLRWLLSMQYNGENMFFIPEEIRPKIIGGFRHDYFNHEAWIDSAGHIMLGCARLITENKLQIYANKRNT